MKIEKKTQLSVAYGILILLCLLSLSNFFENQVDRVPYSQFRQWVTNGQVAECIIGSDSIRGKALIAGAERGFVTARVDDAGLIDLLEENQVRYSAQVENTWLTTLLSWILPAVFFCRNLDVYGATNGRWVGWPNVHRQEQSQSVYGKGHRYNVR